MPEKNETKIVWKQIILGINYSLYDLCETCLCTAGDIT